MSKLRKGSTFTYQKTAESALTKRERSLLQQILLIPAHDVLSIGLVATLGIAGVSLVNIATDPPARQSNAELLTSSPVAHQLAGSTDATVWIFWIVMSLLSLLFWISLAYMSKRTVWWFANRINQTERLLWIQWSLVVLGWMPIGIAFGFFNPTRRSEILVLVSSIIAMGCILFWAASWLQKKRIAKKV